MVTSMVAWVGYRIQSNERWASRSLVLEAAGAFEGTIWAEDDLLRVDTMATAGCAGDNGAESRRDLVRVGRVTDLQEPATLQDLESARVRLQSFGFAMERSTIEQPEGRRAMLWMTRGDDAIYVSATGGRIRIRGATNSCNSALLFSLMDRESLVEVADYRIESVCDANLLEAPDFCA